MDITVKDLNKPSRRYFPDLRGTFVWIPDLELKKMEDNMAGFDWFYKIDKDGRWLPSPYDIGGRDSDVYQIYFTLMGKMKEAFPPNGIPQDIMDSLKTLEHDCKQAEDTIEAFIELVSKHLVEDKK